MKQPLPDAELRRAKDHLKGSLMLSLESTSSRMSNLARQEMYFDRQFSLDETLESIERVTRRRRRRVAGDLFVERLARRDGAGPAGADADWTDLGDTATTGRTRSWSS